MAQRIRPKIAPGPAAVLRVEVQLSCRLNQTDAAFSLAAARIHGTTSTQAVDPHGAICIERYPP